MKANKFTIERLVIEDSTMAECEQLVKDGYEYKGENYFGEFIYEKIMDSRRI
jgi:hypothetical protein